MRIAQISTLAADEFRFDRAVEGLNQYRGALAAHADFAGFSARVVP